MSKRLTPDELAAIKVRLYAINEGLDSTDLTRLLEHAAALEAELALERATATAAMSTADGALADLETAWQRCPVTQEPHKFSECTARNCDQFHVGCVDCAVLRSAIAAPTEPPA